MAILGFYKKDSNYMMTWLLVFFAFIFASDPTAVLLMYFSPPSWLTLGYKIGGFAPTSCEVSKLIEGPRSWPCQALEFKVWLVNVAGPGGWKFQIQPEPVWLAYLFFLFLELVLLVILALLPAKMDRDWERTQRKRHFKEQKRKWDIERGIERGIAGWKANAKCCTDEKNKQH